MNLHYFKLNAYQNHNNICSWVSGRNSQELKKYQHHLLGTLLPKNFQLVRDFSPYRWSVSQVKRKRKKNEKLWSLTVKGWTTSDSSVTRNLSCLVRAPDEPADFLSDKLQQPVRVCLIYPPYLLSACPFDGSALSAAITACAV